MDGNPGPIFRETTYSAMGMSLETRDLDTLICVDENGDDVTITFDTIEQADRFILGYKALEDAGHNPWIKLELVGYDIAPENRST